MAKILLVEDDPIISKSLFPYIRSENHEPVWVRRLAEAEAKLAREPFDLVLLDVGLPDGDGVGFCRRLRESGSTLPVIILTALTSEDVAVGGLTAGANDFVRKPFSTRELLTRIRIQLYGVRAAQTIRVRKFAGLEVDIPCGQVRHGDRKVRLSRKKLEILSYLMANADRIVSREALLQHLRKETEVYDRTVDAHISQLRRTLRANGLGHVQIASIYGAGYKIENLQTAPAAL